VISSLSDLHLVEPADAESVDLWAWSHMLTWALEVEKVPSVRGQERHELTDGDPWEPSVSGRQQVTGQADRRKDKPCVAT
jgi:hypothetical protein